MLRINLMDAKAPSVWSRLRWKVRQDRAKYGPLYQAVHAMKLEQRAAGERAGMVMCDLPWCSCQASHDWQRTPAEIKASRTKRGKAVQEMAPYSVRCETHIPAWRSESYSRIAQAVPFAA